MQQNIREVMTSGIHSVELAIQGVGEPSKWMPVVGLCRGQGPSEGLPSDSRPCVEVVGNIGIIVVADKGIEISGSVKGESAGEKQARDQGFFSVGKSAQ